MRKQILFKTYLKQLKPDRLALCSQEQTTINPSLSLLNIHKNRERYLVSFVAKLGPRIVTKKYKTYQKLV